MNIDGNELKKGIVDSVKNKKEAFIDVIALIRCIYNEYNIRINYDYSWLYRKNFNVIDNFDDDVTFSGLTCNKFNCNEWCQLLKELLVTFSIPDNIITIKRENDTHKWLEVKLQEGLLILDGTTNYHGFQDITNCKMNYNTIGFILANDDLGISLEQRYKDGLLSEEEIEKQGILFKKIDNVLAFSGNPIYKDIKDKCDLLLSDEEIFTSLYNLLSNYNSEYVLNGSDLSRYLKRLLKDRNISIGFLAYFINDFIETCCEISNDNNIMFYSENTGLLLNDSYKEYKDNNVFVKRIK